MPTDFYDVLGVPADASSDELKGAYRSRVREYHPDVNDHPDGDAQFKLIRKANDVLTDPSERKDYDRMGHREYASKRLDELPPFSVFPELEDAASGSGGNEETDSGTDTSSRTSSRSRTSSSTANSSSQTSTSSKSSQRAKRDDNGQRSRSSRNSRKRQSASSSGSTAGSSASKSKTTEAGSGSSQQTASGTASQRTQRDGSRSGSNTTTAGAETDDSTGWANLSADAAKRNASESAGARRRRGLRRWYGVVLVALLSYVGGVGAYFLAHRSSALALVSDLQTAPVETLLGTFPLRSPTGYLVGAVDAIVAGTPTPALLVLVGTVLLPLVVLTAVAQFGRGSAWGYALLSLGPAATFAAYPFVILPVAAILLGLVVLPLVSGFGFLVDVGRYLLATR